MTDTDFRPNPKAIDDPRTASLFALAALLLIVVSTPWAMGAVSPLAVRAVTLAALATCVVVLVLQARQGAGRPTMTLWPLAAITVIVALQVLPLPHSMLSVVAPSAASLWHPAEATAAAILGEGARPISISPEATTRAWLLWCAVAGLAALAAPAAGTQGGATLAASVIALNGLALAIYAVVARAIFGSLLYGRFKVPTVAPFGPFVSKNHFCGYVEMAALLTLGLALGLKDREAKHGGALDWVESPRAARVLTAFAAAFVMALAVFLSLSRGGALALVSGAALLIIVYASSRPTSRWVLLAALLLVGVVAAAALPREAQRRFANIAASGGDAAASFRVETWRAAARLAAVNPILGSGVGTFVDALPRFKRASGELRIEHAENDYLEWLAETGLVGAAWAVAALAVVLRAALARLDAGLGRLHRGIVIGSLGAMGAFLVHAAVDFNSRIPSNAGLFVVMAALAAGGGWRRLGPWTTRIAAVACAGLLAVAWSLPAATASGGRDDIAAAVGIADPVGRGLRLERAEAALRETLARRPADAESWFLLGWTRVAQGHASEGASLARYGSSLDPARLPLRSKTEELLRAVDAGR